MNKRMEIITKQEWIATRPDQPAPSYHVHINLDKSASWLFALSHVPTPAVISIAVAIGLIVAMLLGTVCMMAFVAMNTIAFVVLGLAFFFGLVIVLSLMVRM